MSDNSNSKNGSTAPRLSIRIPRNINPNISNNSNHTVSFREGELMSPRTTTVSHPSSSFAASKEVPRAALIFTDPNYPPSTATTLELSSPITSTPDDQMLRNLVEDSIQGLKALAASAAAASIPESDQQRVSSPPEFVAEMNEDAVLGNLFTDEFGEKKLAQFYSEYCATDSIVEARDTLNTVISKADALLQAKGISMSLENIVPFYLHRLVEQEATRTGNSQFTGLLLDARFLSGSTTVLFLLPRLVSILIPVAEIAETLDASLFDVLLAIEPLLKALPELLKLPETQRRLKQLQQVLLEDLVWKSTTDGDNVLYRLLENEFKVTSDSRVPFAIASTLSGIRSSQKALETLSGFPAASGSRVTRLELFFRKYLRLASQRLQSACLRLGLSPAVTQLAWELFFDLVQREGDASLFKNRHLNQILAAVIYCSSRLLEQERNFQQICQVLPQKTSNDVYTFYIEIFMPPLRKRIETFLAHRDEAEGEDWILNGLFTTAPFPLNPIHQIGSGNVTLNRLNQPKPKYQPASTLTKYEWTSPYGDDDVSKDNSTTNTTLHNPNQQVHPQTPSNTSQLLNGPSSPQTDFHDHHKRRPDNDSDNGTRIKKVARRLDFSEE